MISAPEHSAALVDAALSYARRGWSVFPAHTPRDGGCSCRRKECDRVGKHPRTQHGFADATTDERLIRRWWRTWPDANVCIRTGSGLVVIDIDPDHGGDESFDELVALHGVLPETVECITGSGGRHLFFRCARPLRCSIGLIAPGIDVRGDDGYVVTAPSLHTSGRAYAWELSHHPDEKALADLPEWLERLASRSRAVPSSSPDMEGATHFIEGGRNKALASLAGSMRRRGMSSGAIEAALVLENAEKCRPPLNEAEVRRIARSVARYAAAIDPSREAAALPEVPWAFQRGDHLEVAQATLERLATGPLTYDEGDFWRYEHDHGTWERIEPEAVAYAASQFAGCPVAGENGNPRPLCVSDASLKGIVNVARVLLLNRADRARFAAKRFGVAFRNGFVVVENGQASLLPHAPEHMGRHAFEFDYDPHAPAPRLAEFFSELFDDVTDDEAGGREAVLQEFVGACLTGCATRYQKLLLIAGTGGNGKSEFLRLARGLFPPGTVASVPPQEWGERFKASRLVGILANFVDEIPEREIASGDVFKSVITGDPVSTERKNRDPFEFRPIAGHIFSANSLPGTVDHSDGYWRRFAVCPFTRDFSRASGRKPDAAADVLAHELPGLAAWAIAGAARLQRQGAYTATDVAEKMLSEWRDESDPIRRFVRERRWPIEVRASALYDEWRSWARANGFADMSSTKFGRRVMATGLVRRADRADGRVYSAL